jgi:PAS domain S-box-containing protein
MQTAIRNVPQDSLEEKLHPADAGAGSDPASRNGQDRKTPNQKRLNRLVVEDSPTKQLRSILGKRLSGSDKTRDNLVKKLSVLRERVAQQERNAAVHRASLDAIITIDHEGTVVDFNAAAEAIFGYSQAEVVGKKLSQLVIPPQLRDRHQQGLARNLATGEGSILNKRLEMPACRADGTEFPVELTITRMESAQHPLFIGFMRDITEQKALRDDQARLAAIVEFSENAIVSKTGDGIIISWNHGAERLYGYSAKEMIGQSISILFAPDHFREYVEIMKKVNNGVLIPSFETARRRKDGTEVNVSVGISLIKKREGEVVEASIISHNITEKKSSD